MKALETVKNLLRWGPSVAKQLERIDAIDERLAQIAASQQDEQRLVPEAEHVVAIVDWIRRRGQAKSSLGARPLELLLPLGFSTPRDPQLVGADLERLLFLFFGEQMEHEAPRVAAAITARHTAPRGRPAAERPAILARLSAERAQLVAERAQLVDAIGDASAGTVMVVQLPETRHERDVAKQVAEQARVNEEIQRQHKAGVPVGTPAAVRSPFIQSGERGR